MKAAELATKLYEALASEGLRRGGKLTKPVWLACTAQFLEANRERRPKSETPISKMTDAEFMAWLEENETFAGLDIKKEIGKCQNWCAVNRKQCTRRRLVTWMGNAEKPFSTSMQGQSSQKAAVGSIYDAPPEGWREAAARIFPHTTIAERDWKEVRILYGRQILEGVAKGLAS